ncbi:hypothetical protein SAMN02910298_00063 [Pseudobutyrivibrio sp. YE44]|uniref:hypothetical protein n=1 Tax=Pseudobutyrivibrio sp. YE44 TaxID=1520802 RepID=UPI000887659E|nr:hypothetical protein [Pseudobutyrivibrio sp. YE44]SDB04789.1 hypothetical protein SAMN02910298_00063 [Pseudobutyrivibrio sp. YE44]
MNKKLKTTLELLAVLAITIIIALSSPFNPWITGAEDTLTQVQHDILDIAHSVRDGYLAYVELDGHYGPVLYEFYGLGYLLTETHIVHFIMETVVVFFSVLFVYKTSKLYTSEIFALLCTIVMTVFSWGALTHAGAEELLFFLLSLTCYHVARQLKFGFLSYHTYLLAIDFGLVFFLQPGYSILWIILFVFFAIKIKLDGLEGKEYRAYYISLLEGLITVSIPMGLYLWYFKNARAFVDKVVIYNLKNLGGFGQGLGIVAFTPWILFAAVLIVVIIIKAVGGDKVKDLCCWLGFIVAAILVFSLQADKVDTMVQLSKALYVIPFAAAFSLLDKPLGLKPEERKY